MSLLITLTATVLLVYALSMPIQKLPMAFYLFCVLLVIAGVHLIQNPDPSPVLRMFATIMQKGYIALSLFSVVMLAGALPKVSIVRRKLIPIRAELSIMASVLICSHMITYLVNYSMMLSSFMNLKPSVIFSLIISIILLLLLIVLAVTSFKAIRNRMNPTTWKKLQRLSYLFYALVYCHLFGYLLVPVLQASVESIIHLVIYTCIFGGYTALRIRKALADCAAASTTKTSAETSAEA
ncbi:MAG: ferric reductase-like transmembrane domain-containing protein [Coriobacteriia bacterium]|nr:ferric reductase-like transmembrane domain-containing protein [Coriobacteriia bacterium]